MVNTDPRPTVVAEVYLQIRPLAPGARPAVLVRDDGATLIVVDPRTSRQECVDFFVTRLTRGELNAYRAAYRQPPVGRPLPDYWLSDDPLPTNVPASLRLGCEQAQHGQQAG